MLATLFQNTKAASLGLATRDRNAALKAIQYSLNLYSADIVQHNSTDVASERAKNTPEPLIDRLTLTPRRLQDITEAISQVMTLPDPLNRVLDGWQHPSGANIQKITVPFGVIGMIYESRPNVTIDAAVLCLKAGSAVILRGSSNALNSNRAIVKAMRQGLQDAGFDPNTIGFIDSSDRNTVTELLTARGYVDLVIPRGGVGLIKHVVENAKVPVIETGAGNCHLYVHSDADQDMALSILLNGKCQRPGVCNSLEKLLVHAAIAPEFVPKAVAALQARGVEVKGCERTLKLAPIAPMPEAEWAEEYLDLMLGIKIVDTLPEAVQHINRYSTHHSEAIITQSLDSAQYFQNHVDSAAVYVNCSTRFTDGFEFGFGAEIGISTQKMHARGPMGLNEMVTYQYRITGNGQIR